ncbi:hypothetical protein LNKW23_48790 [Paralimibaculum aggregatum]|uniref:Biopolymer transporter ExbD n=1 Tax=Paralimibaculum aggregatum TaxID=3036245 RepID=A0ABQ6LU90_9RHOB|nr:biopolymer transporter ExbD [Limibaculum sp. NKW23]GMG85654.1 hypothetical protein LNKW23_48790 [Limibaculum sp. NKW23]
MQPFAFGTPRRARRPSLTPMIDVVFLLLVFFMLAAHFSGDRRIALLPPSPEEGVYAGAPRIVTVAPDGLKLNGAPVALEDLAAALRPLLPAPDALVVVQSTPEARLQQLVVVLDHLAAERLGRPVIAE